jgi:Na+/H+ antiporter NhaC
MSEALHSEHLVKHVFVIPGFLSVLPSAVTVIVAIWSKQNILALLCGVSLGSFFYQQYNPVSGILTAIDTLVVNSIADKDHAYIMYFCMMIGGMIAVVGRVSLSKLLVLKSTE